MSEKKKPAKKRRDKTMVNVRIRMAPPVAERINTPELMKALILKIAKEQRTPPGVEIAAIEWGHPKAGSVRFRRGDISDLENLRRVIAAGSVRVGVVDDTTESL